MWLLWSGIQTLNRGRTDLLLFVALCSSTTSLATGSKLQGRHPESHSPATQQALKRAIATALSKIHCPLVARFPPQQFATKVAQKSKPIARALNSTTTAHAHLLPYGDLQMQGKLPCQEDDTQLLANLCFQSSSVVARPKTGQ